ncbi:MAG TPA: PAS domain S-box protein, partial [Gaiellaceae bacterium]|nr:PAS domain S-box protein [Gaiellaceae bacterium]
MTPDLAERETSREHELIEAALAVNGARSLDDGFAILAATGVELLGASWLCVVVWDSTLGEGRVHAAAGEAQSLVGIPIGGSDELRNAIRSGIAFNGRPDVRGFDDETAKAFAASVVVRVPLSIEGCRATFHAGWRDALTPDETDRATQLLMTLTRLSSLAERTRSSREHARLETVLEGVADGVILTTESGLTLNAAARRMLAVPDGLSLRTALLNPRALDGEPIRLDPSLRPGEATLASNTEGGHFRIRCTALDGTELVVDGNVAPVEGGSVIAFRDVTQEYRREFLTEQYIRALFDAIPAAIVVRDPKTGEAIAANRAFVRLVGLPIDEILGVGVPSPWMADDRRDSMPAVGETSDRLLRTADGRTFPVEVSVHAVEDDDGQPALVFAIVNDLSERRRLEQQVVQSGKLAAIGELAAGVAHEINNPLFAILGMTEFLLLEAEPGSKARERLELIQQTGGEIKEIVRGLLDFARDTNDDQQLVSAADIVHSTLDLVR